MSLTVLTSSPLWTTAGWTMLHLLWVGLVIGLVAALARRLFKPARPEVRYGVALGCLLMLAISPAAIFVRVLERDTEPSRAQGRAVMSDSTARVASLPSSESLAPGPPDLATLALNRPNNEVWQPRLDVLVSFLPYFWLSGTLSTLIMLATGLVGIEHLRRSSRLDEKGDLSRRCRALADSLGIARRVSVRICDRLAMPVLIGIVRPLILLPPAALSGWSTEQLEMILLHELAHLRRWDNLVNLLQRVVESLLFFHPVVWWLSGWVRLERELCCDRLVVERLGQPVAYADMLMALSGMSGRRHQAMLAMADRHVLTRIRRLFNLEERSMKLTMPEGLGLLGAVIVAALLMLGSHAAPPKPASDPKEMMREVPGTAVDDTKDNPPLEVRPPAEQEIRKDTGTAAHPLTRTPPMNPRTISLFPRGTRTLQIVQLPTTPEGVVTYQCRGGIKIVCKWENLETISMEADEAVIKRAQRRKGDEGAVARNGETWIDEAALLMEVHLKGDVVVHHRDGNITAKGDERTVRASQLDFDFVTGRLTAPIAQPDSAAPNAKTPMKDDIKVMPRDAPQDVLVPGALPSPVTIGDTRSTPSHSAADHQAPVPASRLRTTTLLARSAQRLQITQLAETIEGVVTLVCRGGIKIVGTSPRFGTISMEADEAVIVRNLYRRKGETHSRPDGATWAEEDELPMRVHLKGDVILRQNQQTTAKNAEPRTFRARELDYNFVTDRVVAFDAELEEATAGAETPVKIASPRIEQFHPMVRQPDGSLAPSEHPEIRVGGGILPKPSGEPSSASTKTKDRKTSAP
jgi:beta-lactamase regulating signal transducer with metallopeptidase domain